MRSFKSTCNCLNLLLNPPLQVDQHVVDSESEVCGLGRDAEDSAAEDAVMSGVEMNVQAVVPTNKKPLRTASGASKAKSSPPAHGSCSEKVAAEAAAAATAAAAKKRDEKQKKAAAIKKADEERKSGILSELLKLGNVNAEVLPQPSTAHGAASTPAKPDAGSHLSPASKSVGGKPNSGKDSHLSRPNVLAGPRATAKSSESKLPEADLSAVDSDSEVRSLLCE